MNSYQEILEKLNQFVKKYYTKQLIKGVLLFLAIGLLFLLGVGSLEFLFWLNGDWRLLLFFLVLVVELFLLYRFILIPVLYLFRVRKGISNKEASLLIGRHFTEVDDKLYNLLELAEDESTSELLLASIEQRSEDLGNVSFVNALDFRESFKYARYVLIPLLIVGFIWISGNIASFFSSYKRVVNYDLAFEQPAPFSFQLLNDKLEVLDNESLTIQVRTIGDLHPENVFMVIDGEELLLKKMGDIHSYTFEAPVKEGSFYFVANGWGSRSYSVRSLSTPELLDFEMKFDFPKYTERSSEVIRGTGNGVVPEGTLISWNIVGEHVEEIVLAGKDTIVSMEGAEGTFGYARRVHGDFMYTLSTSNKNVREYERLQYEIEVFKDEHPSIDVEQVLDSLNVNQSFYSGQVSDDYRVKEIWAVCYTGSNQGSEQRVLLESPNAGVYQFYYTFPSGFEVEEGKDYSLYFEVIDNDGLRNGKVRKSRVFTTTLYDDKELIKRELEYRNSMLKGMNRSLNQYKEQQQRLEQINARQKEEKILDFEDRNEVRDFLRKQEHQEELMEKFSRQLKAGLEKEQLSDEAKQLLKERLERQEQEAKRNEKLLEELEEIADKIDKEELQKRLEELSKNQSANTRNLEQILELTKRYYVTEKMAQLARDLEKTAERQELLSNMKLGEELDNKLQEEVNEEFSELSKELDSLRKDNQALKKPIKLDVNPKDTEAIKKDQKDALEEINKHQGNEESSEDEEMKKSGNKISKKQKSAADKMREMSKALQQMSSGGGSSITEDAEMLRQILDNLVTFSFKQENLMENVERADVDISRFSKTIRDQRDLRRLFEHVDDSLFALSLRRAELSEFVNEQISEVYYNMDKSLENIAENQVFQGASHQQYVVNATNALADFLANILDNMQQSMMPGQGGGQGEGFQLPDIIQGQQGIGEKMGNSKGSEEGPQGSEGQKGQGRQGESGKTGEGQQNGNEGKGGSNGKGEGGQGDANQGQSGGDSNEMGLEEVFEIYKEQQYLRQQLEQQLNTLIDEDDKDLAKKLVRQMEDFENDLLENGITERTRNKANTIEHELLKLKNASLEQGKKKERESNTNQDTFSNPIITRPEILDKGGNEVEILNRQALPLQQIFDKKVKSYFKGD